MSASRLGFRASPQTKELLQLITSNYYSILYYNSEIWHQKTLKPRLTQMLHSASARALKITLKYSDFNLSFDRIHQLCKRAKPADFLLYKQALLLHTLINTGEPSADWTDLNFQQLFSRRGGAFQIAKANRLKIGTNIPVNRMYVLNGMIELDWLNLSRERYKVKIKSKFLGGLN